MGLSFMMYVGAEIYSSGNFVILVSGSKDKMMHGNHCCDGMEKQLPPLHTFLL